MAELTPLQKLDYVLERTHHQRDYFHVYTDLGKDETLSINQHDLNMILNKLQRDGYVDFIAGERYVTGQQASEGLAIRRNFEGDLFIADGGYVENQRRKTDKEISEASYLERAETYAKRLSTWTEQLKNWTKYLTYATIIVGSVLLLWDVLKFLVEHSDKIFFVPLTI